MLGSEAIFAFQPLDWHEIDGCHALRLQCIEGGMVLVSHLGEHPFKNNVHREPMAKFHRAICHISSFRGDSALPTIAEAGSATNAPGGGAA